MFEVRVNGEVVFACTDESRFRKEVVTQYANVSNARLFFNGEPYKVEG